MGGGTLTRGNPRSAGSEQVSGVAYPNYRENAGLSTADSPEGRQAVASAKPAARGCGPARVPASTTPAHRDIIRRTVQKAIDHADNMIRAAEAAEPIDLSNAGFDLWRSLTELWAMRQHREPNWGDLLNMLQGCLARETYETFDAERCRLIRRVLVDYLKPWTVQDEDVGSAIELIQQAGLDPWKGISAE